MDSIRLPDIIAESLLALKSNASRTALTSIGIVIGIAAVICLTSVIGGIQNSLFDEMGLSKSRLVYIVPNDEGALDTGSIEALKEGTDEYDSIAFLRHGTVRTASPTQSADVGIFGVEADYFRMESLSLEDGAFFQANDNREASQVAVVGPGIVESFFDDEPESAIGKKIRIGDSGFTVIGVIEVDGIIDQNHSAIYVPEKTSRQALGFSSLYGAMGSVRPEYDVARTITHTKEFLAGYFDYDDLDSRITVMSLESAASVFEVFALGFSLLMALISSISLLVGGIGIMNMMLTNVSERIHEIGLKKAIGARSRDISRQFLFESVIVSLLGGVLGIAVGYMFAFLLSSFVTAALGFNLTPVFSPAMIITAFLACLTIGILFGHYPARIASEWNPAKALTH